MENLEKDEMRREIPERFRASLDAADKAAYELLAANDREQKELAERVNAPFQSHSPKDRMRSNALVTIREYEEIKDSIQLFPHQIEELSEAYAAVGQYEKAAKTTTDTAKRDEFTKIHQAVWLDDEDWCDHAGGSKYIKDYVWSIREQSEMPLMACNLCNIWNVKDAPERLLNAQKARARVRDGAPQNLSIEELKQWHEQNAPKRKD